VKNVRKALHLFWPLVLGSLLVAVRSRRNRTPTVRQDSDVKPNYSSYPYTFLTSSLTTNDSPKPEVSGTPWWKGLPEAGCLVVALGLSVITAWQARAASHAAQKANDATQNTTEKIIRQLEILQRPWVSINADILSPLTFNSNGTAQVTLQFAIRNVGSTPAKGLSVEPKMFVASFGEQDPVMVRSRVCEENRTRGTATYGTLFPTVELTKSMTFHVDAKEITGESNRAGSFSPALVVCASYTSTFDDSSRYTTGIIYYLHRIDPAHPGTFVRMTNGMNIPRELLALNYDPIGETVAN
jgi:hypothetical protein